MKKLYLSSFFLVSILLSCKKDDDAVSVSGIYTETLPAAGRSQLEFRPGNIVIKSEPGSTVQDSFTYAIGKGKISLTPTWTDQFASSEFDFRIIDDSTIEIENLYLSIPESPKSYMTYKK